jgi:hypothetical protein
VNWLRLQIEQNDNLAERVQAEIDAELGVRSFYYALLQRLTLTSQTPLECSKRGVARVTPNTREEYLDAVAVDRVWIQGYHWPRAVSIIAGVRVGVAIYPFDSIIYYGRGNERRILMLWCPKHGSVRDVHQLCFHDCMMTCFAAVDPGSSQRA